ncbi:hypothetical protein PORY_001660 [Pneumocystis oryctolagi]|uniref:Uncharacterized protein n=1 Tax=Pneumocystis oryctolagi TaxID=42067 RepID=A0ACB7CBX7_9ASCO|nr:hypothetical protein PORY_001660 [Pneumocystis oryctolagi]
MKQNNQKAQNFIIAYKFCAALGTIYAKCVIKNSSNIQKDICISEFQKFKNCLKKIIKHSLFYLSSKNKLTIYSKSSIIRHIYYKL